MRVDDLHKGCLPAVKVNRRTAISAAADRGWTTCKHWRSANEGELRSDFLTECAEECSTQYATLLCDECYM